MKELLELRWELLHAIDNPQNEKKDLVKVIEEVSKKLLLLYRETK